MLSYNWDHQELVKKVAAGLKKRGVPVWMDIEGGVSGDINSSMAEGVDGSKAICCFMTQKYQDSKNCKRELTYADTQDRDIIPIMVQASPWKQTGWLGIVTAGLLYLNFRDESNLETKIDSLAKEIISQTGSSWMTSAGPARPTIADQRPQELHNKVSRAFKHCLTGKFLAESGQVKFHPQSGNRSTLVLSNNTQDTSFWVEERKEKKSEIIYFQNYFSKGYLGHDPNGDYTYTKGQHYGAEEWLLMSDNTDTSGRRAVVIFANFGKKYLAIKNGKLTGVTKQDPECRWYLE